MIVDSSAVVAILREEPEAEALVRAIASADLIRMPAGTLLATALVVDSRRNPIASRRLDEFLRESLTVIEPVTEAQVHIARDAYRDFGKGSGHPASLNFGDLFAYALARVTGEPLLYKGDDFSQTDVPAALSA